MAERRIVKVPADMGWEDFRKKYWKFFPISVENKRLEKLKAEYFRLTGKKANEAKSVKSETRKADAGRIERPSGELGKGSRIGSDKPEHGSTVSGTGLEGEKPAEL